MATKKRTTNPAVMIRCYAGVFYGRLLARRGREVDLVGARHIYQWTSTGLSRKALTVEDLAILGAGSDTRISGAADVTVFAVTVIARCTDEAIRVIEALPCRA